MNTNKLVKAAQRVCRANEGHSIGDLNSALKALDAVLEETNAQTDESPVDTWIPVKEQLPVHGKKVWVHFKFDAWEDCKAWYCTQTKRWYPDRSDGWSTEDSVTHWMLLPKPPVASTT